MEPAADILLPPPPPWWALHGPWLLATGAALMAAAAALRWARRRRRQEPPTAPPPDPSPEAAADPREQAYRLAHLLRQGLGLRRLHPEHPPAGIPPAAWDRLVRALDAARYPPRPQPLDPALLREARRWLEARQGGAR